MAFSDLLKNGMNFIQKFAVTTSIFPGLMQVQHYAARKGTRVKAIKKKLKNLAAKMAAKKIDAKKKFKSSSKIVKPDALLYNLNNKILPVDDVYYRPYYKWVTYPFIEVISKYKDYFDPTMYDKVDSDVNIFVELNLKGVKKTKPIKTFERLVIPMHRFQFSKPKKILVFCNSDEIDQLIAAGATTAGGIEIIKRISSGDIDINDYSTIIGKATMMAEILTIRSILKRRLPNRQKDTLGLDLLPLIEKHLHAIYYTVEPYLEYPEYGRSTICVGTLNMNAHQLEENMRCVIESIMSAKPKRPGSFITRIRTQVPDSKEKFQIDHNLYIEQIGFTEKKKVQESVDEEEDSDIDNEEEKAEAIIT